MMSVKMLQKISFALTVIMFACVASDNPAQDSPRELKPVALADGFSLGGTLGTVRRASEGEIVFCPENTLSDDIGSIQEGRCIEILESSGLEVIKKTLKDQPLTVRVWGMITEYKKDNFAYINYVLPVAGEKAPEEEAGEDEPAQQNDDDDIIPDDILSKLRSGEGSLAASEINAFDNQKRDRIYAGKVGVIKFDEQQRAYFTPDGLGRNLRRKRLYLLRSRVLDESLAARGKGINDVRFNIAGIVSEYDGKEYLLLQRAVRAYNYGNFE
jgi:hypothetical protein